MQHKKLQDYLAIEEDAKRITEVIKKTKVEQEIVVEVDKEEIIESQLQQSLEAQERIEVQENIVVEEDKIAEEIHEDQGIMAILVMGQEVWETINIEDLI